MILTESSDGWLALLLCNSSSAKCLASWCGHLRWHLEGRWARDPKGLQVDQELERGVCHATTKTRSGLFHLAPLLHTGCDPMLPLCTFWALAQTLQWVGGSTIFSWLWVNCKWTDWPVSELSCASTFGTVNFLLLPVFLTHCVQPEKKPVQLESFVSFGEWIDVLELDISRAHQGEHHVPSSFRHLGHACKEGEVSRERSIDKDFFCAEHKKHRFWGLMSESALKTLPFFCHGTGFQLQLPWISWCFKQAGVLTERMLSCTFAFWRFDWWTTGAMMSATMLILIYHWWMPWREMMVIAAADGSWYLSSALWKSIK